MMQRSVAHTHSLFVKEPPKYLLDPSAPFVDGKEDSEIDFSVSTGGFHILPLSIKVGILSERSVERARNHLEYPSGEWRSSISFALPRREDE